MTALSSGLSGGAIIGIVIVFEVVIYCVTKKKDQDLYTKNLRKEECLKFVKINKFFFIFFLRVIYIFIIFLLCYFFHVFV